VTMKSKEFKIGALKNSHAWAPLKLFNALILTVRSERLRLGSYAAKIQ